MHIHTHKYTPVRTRTYMYACASGGDRGLAPVPESPPGRPMQTTMQGAGTTAAELPGWGQGAGAMASEPPLVSSTAHEAAKRGRR